jgi:hypothetical protein
MAIVLFALGALSLLLLFLLFVFFFGRAKKHQGGWICSLYKAIWLSAGGLRGLLRWRHLLSVLFGAAYAYLLVEYYGAVWPSLEAIFERPQAMRVLSFLVTPWPVVLFFVFQFADPGTVTASNVLSYVALYPPDGKLYEPSHIPGTLWPMVPRSGYCGWTKRWIALYDHYCPWVGQPIGERTIRLFLLFIISSIAIATVGSVGFLKYAWSLVEMYDPQNRRELLEGLAIVALQNWELVVSIASTVSVEMVLVFFLGRICVECSKNMTMMEWKKRDIWRKNHPNEKFVNAYDKGFLTNWKLILWPPFVAQHPPYIPKKESVNEAQPSTATQNGDIRKRDISKEGHE